MFIPDQLARIRYEDRLSKADLRRTAAQANAKARTSGFDKLQSLAVFIGIPLRESLHSPISKPRSVDISTR